MSSGNSALRPSNQYMERIERRASVSDIREAADESELVGDLAALVGDLLLCLLELLLGSAGLEGYLLRIRVNVYLEIKSYTLMAGMLKVCRPYLGCSMEREVSRIV